MTTNDEIFKSFENLTDVFVTDAYIELNGGDLITCDLHISNHLWCDIEILFANNAKMQVVVFYIDDEVDFCIYDENNKIVNKYEYEKFDIDNLVVEIIKKIHEYSSLFFDNNN